MPEAPVPKHLIGQQVAEAERAALNLGWDVRVMRRGVVYPSGPFRPGRANLHVDDQDVVIDVSIG